MDVTLSKRGDYVVRSAICLARAAAEGDGRKIREVVAEMDVPRTFASQILAGLVHAGLATSRAGRDGGYRLARPASEISLLEVVEAGEGNLRAERCALGEGPCRWEAVCPLHETWTAATAALRGVLASTTLEELLQRDERLARGGGAVPADSHRRAADAHSFKVSDTVQVEAPLEHVLHAVGREHLLSAALRDAYAEGEAGGAPGGAGRPSLATEPRLHPAVSVGRVEQVGTPAGRRRAVRRLAWDVVHRSGASSRLEGSLAISGADDRRTTIRLDGRFRAPAAAGDGAAPGRSEVAPVVALVVRAFLRHLAAALERAAPADRR